MKKREKDFLERDREYSKAFMKLFAASIIITMLIAGFGLLFASIAGI